MEIILREDIQNVGHKDEVVEVKNGYGRNFLIPQGKAILATESAKKVHAENMRQRAHKEEKLRNEAEEVAAKLKEVEIKVGAKTSTTGKIFGSVTNIQLAESLKEKGYEIERKNITIKDDVKQVGKFNAKVKLYKDITTDIEFEVFSE